MNNSGQDWRSDLGRTLRPGERDNFRCSLVREAGTLGLLGDWQPFPMRSPQLASLPRPRPLIPAGMAFSFIPRLPTLLPCFQLVFPLGTHVLLSPGKGFCTHFLAENGSFIAFSACFLHRDFRVRLQNCPGPKPLQASVEPFP